MIQRLLILLQCLTDAYDYMDSTQCPTYQEDSPIFTRQSAESNSSSLTDEA
jgi:hypothetical protein